MTLEPYNAGAAAAFRRCADELEATMRDDVVSLQEAHAIGGYSVDHLQRMVASGKIANAGRKGSPRIRRCDVPVRPGHRLPTEQLGDQFSDRRRMAFAVITSQSGGT